MKRGLAVIAGIALTALLAGAFLNSVAFGGSNPVEVIFKAIHMIELRLDSLNATVIEQQQQISELQSQLNSLNSTLTSRIEALELNQSALAERITALEDLLRPPQEVVFICDRFDTGLDEWTYWGAQGYALEWVANTAVISGDGYSVLGGMQKVVDLSEWKETDVLLLSFDWRATSDFSSSEVTNARLRIEDADSNLPLYMQPLILGGTLDTGWRKYADDISSYVLGHSRIRIVLHLSDGWIANWDQTNSYDNIKLASTEP